MIGAERGAAQRVASVLIFPPNESAHSARCPPGRLRANYLDIENLLTRLLHRTLREGR